MYYSAGELKEFGWKTVGNNPKVSNSCKFYDIDGHLGNNVRIDDFCKLTGDILIGDNVHIAAGCKLSGSHAQITIGHHVVLSFDVKVLTGSDDYGAKDSLPNSEYNKIYTGPVTIGIGTRVGMDTRILPNLRIGDGCSIGCDCIVNRSVQDGEMLRAGFTRHIGVTNFDLIRKLALRVLENMDGEP
jgi:acetyltransferase-like isoleucine patch superfamily enzyme